MPILLIITVISGNYPDITVKPEEGTFPSPLS
jgi:hypothetical protein